MANKLVNGNTSTWNDYEINDIVGNRDCFNARPQRKREEIEAGQYPYKDDGNAGYYTGKNSPSIVGGNVFHYDESNPLRLSKKLCKPPLSDRINNGGYLYGQEGKESTEATNR